MKNSVYLDTTIPSYLFDEREKIKIHIEATKKWWNQESKNFGSPVKSSDLSYCDRQSSVIVMNKIPNSPDVIFYGF